MYYKKREKVSKIWPWLLLLSFTLIRTKTREHCFKEKCNSILSDARIAKRKKVHLYVYHYQIPSMKSNVKLLSELNSKLIIFRKVYQYYFCLKYEKRVVIRAQAVTPKMYCVLHYYKIRQRHFIKTH